MSNVHEAIAWAIKVSKGEPMPARMLLIVGLAHRVSTANEFLVWPSVRQIAEDTDMSRASVQRWMSYLVEKGLVERFLSTRDNGATSSNRYRLPIRAVFYHPTKGAIVETPAKMDTGLVQLTPMKIVNGKRVPAGEPFIVGDGWGGGPHDEAGGGLTVRQGGPHLDEAGGASPAEACKEQQREQELEDSTEGTLEESELDLGLPPVPAKDPAPMDVAAFVIEQWVARQFVTPIRGNHLTEANAEKARDLGKAFAVPGKSSIDTWRDVFTAIDASDWLQGKVAPTNGRAAFRLSISFVLEKRNFEKILGGRFDGKSTGNSVRGSTSAATGRVIERIRSRGQRGAERGNPALTHG